MKTDLFQPCDHCWVLWGQGHCKSLHFSWNVFSFGFYGTTWPSQCIPIISPLIQPHSCLDRWGLLGLLSVHVIYQVTPFKSLVWTHIPFTYNSSVSPICAQAPMLESIKWSSPFGCPWWTSQFIQSLSLPFLPQPCSFCTSCMGVQGHVCVRMPMAGNWKSSIAFPSHISS